MKRLIKIAIGGGILVEFLAIIGLSTLTLVVGSIFILMVLLELLLSGRLDRKAERKEYKKEQELAEQRHQLELERIRMEFAKLTQKDYESNI